MAKILVVDDDAISLTVALIALEQAGHEVLGAGSGAEGVEMALARAPDLVFMDVQMPNMDGVTALGRLRAEPRTATLKVVALTALAMEGDRQRLLAEGFDGYLEKPIRYKAFLATVEQMLRGGGE
jgi:CheY-like chemotaxis protein